jgi:hypothetical protein
MNDLNNSRFAPDPKERYSNITGRSKERKKRMAQKRIEEIREKIRLTLMRLGATSNQSSEEELLEKLNNLEALEKILEWKNN